MTKDWKKFTAEKRFFGSKTTITPIPRPPLRTSKGEHPALQKMTFLNFF
jgi:hypothetical protein